MVGMPISVTIVRNSPKNPWKGRNGITTWSSYASSGYISTGNDIRVPKRHSLVPEYYSNMYNIQDVRSAYTSISWWTNKMWYSYSMKYYSSIKGMMSCHLHKKKMDQLEFKSFEHEETRARNNNYFDLISTYFIQVLKCHNVPYKCI